MKKHSVFEVLLSCFFIVCMTGCFDSGGNYYFSINNSVDSGPDFVFVEGASIKTPMAAGEFSYASSANPVVVPNFYMCDHQVTQEEYELYCFSIIQRRQQYQMEYSA